MADMADVADVADVAGVVGARVGVADGRFAAGLAARAAGGAGAGAVRFVTAVQVVPPGESRAFLSPFPVAALPDADLADLFARLGVATLGDLAALSAPAVLARFGVAGAAAHRLASGDDERPLAVRVPPPDLTVTAELDPPADRVDTAAFVARSLAGELHERLEARGLACTRVAIEAETEHGERLSRLWRHEGTLGAAAIAERCRWQLDGWLSGGGTSGGLTLLRLVPDEVGPADGRQSAFWGGRRESDEGTARALARVQGLLGPEAVVTAVVGGGRDPAEAVTLVPWGEPRVPARPGPVDAVDRVMGADGAEAADGAERAGDPDLAAAVRRHPSRSARAPEPPWPGRLPGPAPAVVPPRPLPAALRDAAGAESTVSGRGELSAPPVELSIDGRPWQSVDAWAGPWPLEERWWDGGRRRARLQVVAGGTGYLLSRESGGWWVEAVYD
jgi:protein ImuB